MAPEVSDVMALNGYGQRVNIYVTKYRYYCQKKFSCQKIIADWHQQVFMLFHGLFIPPSSPLLLSMADENHNIYIMSHHALYINTAVNGGG
ncbi:MAG: hypothetical protein ORN57_04140 [Alphaproteobacteria bacterium]|nr:hypothetical protein [Alphaproteobacteria bacterium]